MPRPSERAVILTVAAVQFVNIVDFMMVMPLGPDFATGLGIPMSFLGLVGGSYTLSAAAAGILGARFLDRYGRRQALVWSLIGLALGTLAAVLAQGLYSMMAARLLAGAFGGPATSLALSIIADVVPVERRGRAMGTVMGSFAAASVLGVPLGLELAEAAGWRAPFIAVAGMGFAAAWAAWRLLPVLRDHIGETHRRIRLRDMLRRPVVVNAWLMVWLAMMAGFLLIPHLSAYLQFNLGYPRDGLGRLYLVGGALSFFAMKGGGWLTDRAGPVSTSVLATALLAVVLFTGFIHVPENLSVVAMFAAFMVAASLRNVTATTLVTQVPAAHERAGFMAVNSAVQHLAAASGAFVSSLLLQETEAGALVHVPWVAGLALALALTQPVLMNWLVRRLK